MMEQTALCRAWRGILATDLYAFLERAFRDIDQRLNLIPAPYVELLTQALSDVALGGSVTARAGAAGSARWRFLGSPLDGTTG